MPPPVRHQAHHIHRPGFTLVELLVVASVFSLTMLIGTTVFISVQSRQTEILRRQRLVADGRYVLETLARTARLEAIDYRYYYTDGVPGGNSSTGPRISPPGSILVTRNEVNTQTCFRHNSAAGAIELIENCQSNPPDDQWRRITPPDLRVTTFTVLIGPGSNPYAPAPRQSTDCRVNAGSIGFDAASGVCRCRSTGSAIADDCFRDQQCVYPGAYQTANNRGEGLCGDPPESYAHCSGGTCDSGSQAGQACSTDLECPILNANCSAVTSTCTGGLWSGQACSSDEDCRRCYCRNANVQPQVTLFLATESQQAGFGAPTRVALQTVVVSRAYGR